jgi:hypothetical protein
MEMAGATEFSFLIGAIPMCFHFSILRVSSVKTELINCQLNWQHVSTHRVIIRPIIELCLRYIKKKCTFLGSQNVYKVRNMDKRRLIFYNVEYIKIYPIVIKIALPT